MQQVCVLWAVCVCCLPTPTYGCRGLSFVPSFNPRLHCLHFVSLVCLVLSSFDLDFPPTGQAVHTSLQTQSMQPGLRPSTPAASHAKVGAQSVQPDRSSCHLPAAAFGLLHSGTRTRSYRRVSTLFACRQPDRPNTALLYFFPRTPMLYQVRLQYSIHVEARNNSEAFEKACRALRDNPGSHVARVEQAGTPKGKPGVFKRIVTGK